METVSSTSLAAGLVQELDFENTTKKFYDGDYLIMVTDGVLDALPEENAEEVIGIHHEKYQHITQRDGKNASGAGDGLQWISGGG